ncbi:ATP-binding domain-containing protein [Marinobacter pelagius]|uniref:ATP-binding domain-containing protein n=1 Tax=Marinobacter pelagius TaxID=379482 RepID=UPI002852EBB6|nr:ATP-binding domain-containing protein [Marinobacter pelagius]
MDTREQIPITEKIFDCMELGDAITLHKAQGSQFPRVVVALQNVRISGHARLYTAVTRAEAEVHIVGKATDFASITKSVSNANRRASELKDYLLEGKGARGLADVSVRYP